MSQGRAGGLRRGWQWGRAGKRAHLKPEKRLRRRRRRRAPREKTTVSPAPRPQLTMSQGGTRRTSCGGGARREGGCVCEGLGRAAGAQTREERREGSAATRQALRRASMSHHPHA